MFGGLVMFLSILAQVWLFLYTFVKIELLNKYRYDKPTYNKLTVLIIRALQVALFFSVLASLFRIIFICFADKYGPKILRKQYEIYYSYQVVMIIVPQVVEFVYIT